VTLSLSSAGTTKFTALTTSLVGRQLAIVVANGVLSAPSIQEPITGGTVQVTGTYTRTEAEGLAAAFQVGQLPVAVTLGDPG
jgi:SecD/SecF fusion protein